MTRELRFAFWSLPDFREGLNEDREIARKALNVSTDRPFRKASIEIKKQ
jgi:hypothetical protein